MQLFSVKKFYDLDNYWFNELTLSTLKRKICKELYNFFRFDLDLYNSFEDAYNDEFKQSSVVWAFYNKIKNCRGKRELKSYLNAVKGVLE